MWEGGKHPKEPHHRRVRKALGDGAAAKPAGRWGQNVLRVPACVGHSGLCEQTHGKVFGRTEHEAQGDTAQRC